MTTNYSKITIITRREKLTNLQSCLLDLGIDGMTVTEVEGNGQQKGQIEYEDEDGKMTIMLIPKVMVELNITSLSPQKIIDAILPELQTGIIGDGKIFVENISGQIITVRTGESINLETKNEIQEASKMENSLNPMTKITIITRKEKFNDLRKALVAIGITGMTVTNVNGCGKQHGLIKIVEGVTKHTVLIPKIEVNIVVCSVPVQEVIDTALKVLNTKNIGDGKIFTSTIDHAVRVRTGEIDEFAI